MNDQVIVQIFKGVQLALQLEPMLAEAAHKLKALFSLSPDISVNITSLSGEAFTADDQTTALVDAWKKQHGLA